MEIIKHNLKFSRKLIPLQLLKVDAIVYHNTGSSWSTVKSIHNYHLSKGWNGGGYNYLIYKDGSIHEMRGFNIGAQCHKNNSHTIGVAFVGNFNKENITSEQISSGLELTNWLLPKLPNIDKVVGHNYFNNTDCPGKNFLLRIFEDTFNDEEEVVDYCLEFQQWFNEVTQTQKPIKEDGIYGFETEKAYNLIGGLIK